MSEEFVACPFCGGFRTIKRSNGMGWYIGCNDCNMGFSVLEEPERRWNTRPIEDALRRENEQLQAENERLKAIQTRLAPPSYDTNNFIRIKLKSEPPQNDAHS